MQTAVAVLGTISFGVVALSRVEPGNAAWLIVASVCITVIAGQKVMTCQQIFARTPGRPLRHRQGTLPRMLLNQRNRS
jgi:hypothetical protein